MRSPLILEVVQFTHHSFYASLFTHLGICGRRCGAGAARSTVVTAWLRLRLDKSISAALSCLLRYSESGRPSSDWLLSSSLIRVKYQFSR
ncbi:hypothetical protein EVAR_39988_1 [Eumeta japonica]|uniref:Uncharacterized protein n=1 Tax=Eumeta variegata TaxID=151549 RepID=A0A4C1YHV9_EUMVA|nr:hypothetical protein EVAR_39988_1 [Eumeta japonica]